MPKKLKFSEIKSFLATGTSLFVEYFVTAIELLRSLQGKLLAHLRGSFQLSSAFPEFEEFFVNQMAHLKLLAKQINYSIFKLHHFQYFQSF